MKLSFLKNLKWRGALAVAAMGSLGVWGCAGALGQSSSRSDQKVVLNAADEMEFAVGEILPLGSATLDTTLPFIGDKKGVPVETACLERGKKAKQWTTANEDVHRALSAGQRDITGAVLAWIRDGLQVELPGMLMSSWRVTIDDKTVLTRHYATDEVRFSPDQTCITDASRALPASQKVVTTLFGATAFTLSSRSAIDAEVVGALKKAAQKNRIRIKPVATYPRAKDANGKPVFEKRKAMFVAPDGTLVPGNQVPPPKKRPVFELEFTVPTGIYLAFGDMPPSHFAAEKTPEKQEGAVACSINLIFDDMTPRVPECLKNKNMGFGVAMSDTPGEVLVKAATQSGTGEQSIAFDTTGFVQAGGTGFAWVTPRQLEEGAVLEVETLVLHPKDTTPDDLMKFPYGK